MEVYTDWKGDGDLEVGVAFSRLLTQGYRGLFVALSALKPVWVAKRLHMAELLEDHKGIRPPILFGAYDLIRNHLEDADRLQQDLAWMGSEGFPSLVATVTHGARSHQIEDQELLLVMHAMKGACDVAEAAGVRLSIKVTPRHVADSMASGLRFLREGRHDSLGLWLDTPGMEADGQLDPALAVRSLERRLHGLEVHPSMKDADGFFTWLKETKGAESRPLLLKDGQGEGLPWFHRHVPPPKSAAKRAEEEKRERRAETRKVVKDIFPF